MGKNRKNYKNYALAGNRTRVARVAGEHSTTEPPMPYTLTIILYFLTSLFIIIIINNL